MPMHVKMLTHRGPRNSALLLKAQSRAGTENIGAQPSQLELHASPPAKAQKLKEGERTSPFRSCIRCRLIARGMGVAQREPVLLISKAYGHQKCTQAKKAHDTITLAEVAHVVQKRLPNSENQQNKCLPANERC